MGPLAGWFIGLIVGAWFVAVCVVYATATFAGKPAPRHHIYYCTIFYCDARGKNCGEVTAPCRYRTNTPVDV